MSSVKKYAKKAKPAKVKESTVTYDKGEMKIFDSFEEAEDEHYAWLVSLTPEQHLSNALKLIKRVYAKELKNNPKLGKNFSID
jgi:hypothetical protein